MSRTTIICVLIAGATVLIGCTTKPSVRDASTYANLRPVENVIYENLSREAVPFPATTPYDTDKESRGVYLRGFADAWHNVISGESLHGIWAGRPIGLSGELTKVWQAGSDAGHKAASERWTQEYLRIRQE